MATIAVFATLGGGAFAATIRAEKNSVVSSSIKNGKVRSGDLRDSGVTGADLADGGVTGTDIDEGSLGIVPDSDRLDGLSSADFLRFGGTVPSGVTIRGVWGGSEYGAGNSLVQDYSFPMAIPESLSDSDVNFADVGPAANIGTDDDADCTGFATAPTAPPGTVCIYVTSANLTASMNTAQGDAADAGNNRGFQVRGPSNAAGDVEAHGTWAYTAP